MLGRNVFLVLFMGFIGSTAEENQHTCLEEGGFLYDRRCFWVILDLISKFTSAQGEQKCIEFDALPANIYNLQHSNQLLSYGRGKSPTSDRYYSAFLGMKYDPDSNELTNYDGSSSNLPDSVWVQQANKFSTEMGIIIANSPEDTLNGIGTGHKLERVEGVICETEQFSCSLPQINMETQTRTCPEDSPTCTISCKPGFVLDDGSTSITLTCQGNLEWDGEVPTCQLAECTELSFDGQPGLMQCTGYKYQDECNIGVLRMNGWIRDDTGPLKDSWCGYSWPLRVHI